ncbi:CocE/NonD family hydrolase [Streptosporangium sp. NPDC000563]|uniref:CocE/NonD family hydrolase n=1 Tax=unclassified Streptosporangium TaxID=2632669 RepID=UPI003328EE14
MRPPILRERDVRIPLPDGVMLRADVYRDPAFGPRPVLLQYTAYDKSNWASVYGVINPERAVDEGFAVVVVDARGRFRSGGDEPFRPFEGSGADAAACVEWAAAQPWSNGRVGMYGASNNGVPQWQALRHRPPGLRTIVPHFTASEFDGGWVWRGGAFQLGFNLWWSLANLAPDQLRRAVVRDGADAHRTASGALARALRDPDAAFRALPLSDVPALDGVAPHYGEWLAHPPGDPYWDRLSAREALAETDLPVLHVAGWYNVHLDGNLAAYQAIKEAGGPAAEAQRLVIGPWTQWAPALFGDSCGPERRFPVGMDLEGIQLAWFGRHLADGPGPDLPPVRVFVMGADEWRDEQEWPLARARPTQWYLRGGGTANSRHGDGRLSTEPPRGDEPHDAFLYDPRHPVPTRGGAVYLPNPAANSGPMDQSAVEDRDDVLVYSGDPLSEPVEVIGPVHAVLYLRTTAPATDVTAKLVDVHPDGRAYLLCDGIRRITAAEVTAAGDGPIRVEVDLIATGNVFLPGHRIRLEVSSGSFPKYDRHPNTADGTAASQRDLRVAMQTILHDAEHPSALVLPVTPTW